MPEHKIKRKESDGDVITPADQLKQILEDFGMTQKKASEILGIQLSHLCAALRGAKYRTVSEAQIEKIKAFIKKKAALL
jgi:hypothetical protein